LACAIRAWSSIQTGTPRRPRAQSRFRVRKVLTGGIDTTSSTGRLVFGIFATLAKFECDLIKERTMAGLAAARARGRTGGRPRVMTRAKLRTAITMMADQGKAASDVAEQLGISISTLYAFAFFGIFTAAPFELDFGRRSEPRVRDSAVDELL